MKTVLNLNFIYIAPRRKREIKYQSYLLYNVQRISKLFEHGFSACEKKDVLANVHILAPVHVPA